LKEDSPALLIGIKETDMDAAQRGQLLRERFRAMRGHFLPRFTESDNPRKLNQNKTGASSRSRPFFGVSLYERRCEWASQPDNFPTERLPLRRRRKGGPVRVRVAALASKKLRRVSN